MLLAEMIDYETMIDELKAKNELADTSAYVENTDKNKQYFRIILGQHQREDYLPTWEIYALMNMENGQPIEVIEGEVTYTKTGDYYFSAHKELAVEELSGK